RSAEPRARSRSHRGSAPGRTRRGTRCPDERRRSPRPPSPRPGSNGDLASHNALIDAAAVEAGRSPGDIRRLLDLGADLTVDRLAEWALEHGVSVFVFAIDSTASVDRLVSETAPAVREIVQRARAIS